MAAMYILMTIVPLALLIFALIDLITSESWQVKHLPKLTWVFIIVFLPFVGSIVWLIVGKDRSFAASEHVSFGDPRRHEEVASRFRGEADDLEAIEREIQHHEREARIRRLEEQLAARKREQT